MALQHDIYPSINTEGYHHYFLCHYQPARHGKDEISKSLIYFKKQQEHDLTAWVDCSVAEMKGKIDSKCIIVRALHTKEKVATQSPLDILGRELAKASDCSYQPALISKYRLTRSLKSLRKKERFKELEHVYGFESSGEFRKNSFLIIDDILTTGTTLTSIASAISQAGCKEISFYTLARVDYDTELNKHIDLRGSEYTWEQSDKWGKIHEPEVTYEYDLETLKRKILSNFA